MKFNNIPKELKSLKQWCVVKVIKLEDGRETKQPHYWNYDLEELRLLSINDVDNFLDFATATAIANYYNLGVGFVLTENDPYTCIDLDVKDSTNCADKSKWTTQAQYDNYSKIIRGFDSYTERSQSGKGFHVWINATLEGAHGIRRDSVEVYSAKRFIMCTGDVLDGYAEIKHTQDELNELVSSIGVEYLKRAASLDEVDPELSDADLWHKIVASGNGDKFKSLFHCNGQWSALGYESQSEADHALISILCFYTLSNSQVRRMFRLSDLGQRDKAIKNDYYIDQSLKAIRIDNMRKSAGIPLPMEAVDRMLQNAKVEHLLHKEGLGPAHIEPVPFDVVIANNAPDYTTATDDNREDWEIPFPDGLVGKVAKHIYGTTPRPVRELAIATALGWFSGVCGKAWHIPLSGLNNYILVVAGSGTGKEVLNSGMGALERSVEKYQRGASGWCSFGNIASGPAVLAHIADKHSVVHVFSEFGKTLGQMSSEKNTSANTLKTELTGLYHKSGPESRVGGTAYANSKNNVIIDRAVAFSVLGESTPKTFYNSLTDEMMEDGFLSRFLIIQYDGECVPLNTTSMDMTLPDNLTKAVAELCIMAKKHISSDKSVLVRRSAEAASILSKFEIECTRLVNENKGDEARIQLYSRAALKSARIASVLAVADNYNDPVVSVSNIEWAIDLVTKQIKMMLRAINNGDIGTDDGSRINRIEKILRDYTGGTAQDMEDEDYRAIKNGYVTYNYLFKRCRDHRSYKAHKNGAVASFRATIQSFMDAGILDMVDAVRLRELGIYGKAYLIRKIP